MRIAYLLAAFLIATTAHAQAGTQFFWVGGTGSWEDADNWNPAGEGPPTSQDDAVIAGPVTVYISSGATVKNLTYAIVNSTGFFVDGGLGNGDLTVTEEMKWSGDGGWASEGTLTVGGSLLLSANRYPHSNGAIINGGTATWMQGTFSGTSQQKEPVFRNEGELVLNSTSEEVGTFCSFGLHPYLSNGATAELVHTGGGQTDINCQLDNEGVVRVEDGTLALGGAVGFGSTDTYAGFFAVQSGGRLAILNNTHVIEPGASITGGGTVLVSSATVSLARLDMQGLLSVDTLRAENNALVTLDGTTTVPNVVLGGDMGPTLTGRADYIVSDQLDWERGSIGGSGTTTVLGDLTFGGSTSRLVRDTRTLRFTGTTTWTDGAYSHAIDAGARTVNAGTMRLVGPADTRFWGNFLNEGTLTSEIGLNQYTAFTNRGTVRVEGGETRPGPVLDGPDTGRYEVWDDGILSFTGTRTLALGSEVVGTGVVRIPSDVANSATWKPAGSGAIGALTTQTNFLPEDDSRLEIELAGLTPGTDHDVLRIGSASNRLGGTLEVVLLDGYVPETGDTFTVVTCAGFCSGEFDAPADGFLSVGGTTFRVVYNASDVTLDVVETQPVPEFVVTEATDELDADAADGRCDVDLDQSGAQCTLRAAFQEANLVAPQDTARIRFDLDAGERTLAPASPLPPLTRMAIVDGTSQPQGQVVVSGVNLAGAASGFTLASDGVTVRGLVIGGFPGFALDVTSGTGTHIEGTHLGVRPDGTPFSNGLGALRVRGAETLAAVGHPEDEDARNMLYGALAVTAEARARVYLNTMEVPDEEATGLSLRAPLDLDLDGPTCGAWARTGTSVPAPPRVLGLTASSVRGLAAPDDTVAVYRVAELGTENGRYWARRVEPLALGAADETGAFDIAVDLEAGDRIALSALTPDGRISELSQARRPVVFAPGIGGTWLRDQAGTDLWIPVAFGDVKNERMQRLAMQPDGATSVEDLVAAEVLEEVGPTRIVYGPIHDHLVEAGYPGHPLNAGAPDLDQWRFPNDWRLSATVLANDFRALVDRVTTDSGQSATSAARACQVDVVAHSNGGMIASVYLRRDAAHAQDHVHRYLTSGTPYLGADQAYAAHASGYIFGVDEKLDSFALGGWEVAWGDMITMTRNVPGAYGLLPSRAYFDAMDETTPSYRHQFGIVDLYNRPQFGYDATVGFLSRSKLDSGGFPDGLARNGAIWASEQENVHALVDDWQTYEGPPHIFRHVGLLVGRTEVGWFLPPGPPDGVPAGRTVRSEADDTDRHRAYRDRLRPVMGLGDETVPLLSATLGRDRRVGDLDLSGVEESPWIEEFEYFDCAHTELVEEDCESIDGGLEALVRIVETLRAGSVVPSDDVRQPLASARSGPKAVQSEATSDIVADVTTEAEVVTEVVYVMADAPLAVTVTDTQGRLTGPADPTTPGDVSYEVPDVAYHASRLGAVLSIPADGAYTLVARAVAPEVDVLLLRRRAALDGNTQVLYLEQTLAADGTLRLDLLTGGTSEAAAWSLDANGDGVPDDEVAPAVVLSDAPAVPALPIPQPLVVTATVAAPGETTTATLRLPDTGTTGWTYDLEEDTPWLTLSATGGEAPEEVQLRLDASDLPVGAATTVLTYRLRNGAYEYTGSIPVTFAVGIATANEPGPGLPEAFALHAPSPNPFVGRATVQYDVPTAGALQLDVYDILGRRVAVLAEGAHAAGYHEVELDASSLAAGVYVARMSAGDFAQTRTITVVR